MGYRIVWESPQGVVKSHFGQLTGAEVLAANTKIESDPRFDSLRYVINDFFDCTGVTVSAPEIEEIAAIDHSAALINRNIRIAIVAIHPEVEAASKAYASDTLTAYTTRIFSTMADARAWLGLSLV